MREVHAADQVQGIKNARLGEGVEISKMSELAQWTIEADKVFTF